MSEEKYQVLFRGGDGPEQLSDPEPMADAEHTARELTRKGYSVGSVMTVDAAREYLEYRYAPAYRGVKIPDDVRNDHTPRSVYDAWRRGVDSALDVTAPLVEALHFDGPCSFDHHGYCQEHLHLMPGPCPHNQAQELLPKIKEGGAR